VTHEEGTPQFSHVPSVNVRPAGIGVDIVIRCITRAGARVDTCNLLFTMTVHLMQAQTKVNRISESVTPQVGAKE